VEEAPETGPEEPVGERTLSQKGGRRKNETDRGSEEGRVPKEKGRLAKQWLWNPC